MPAERAVTLFRITIKPNMLSQEMLECLQERVIPTRGLQNGAKHPFKTTILIARDADGLAHIIHRANSRQVRRADSLKVVSPVLFDSSQGKRPSHELVVVHPLPPRRYAWSRGKIVGVALAM